jgi:hypothetical protein
MHRRSTARPVVFTGAILAGIVASSAVHADQSCAGTPSQTIEQAQEALKRNDDEAERTAFVCLIAAVAALDSRLRGLSDGTLAFEGQVYAPKGVVMAKSPASEGE